MDVQAKGSKPRGSWIPYIFFGMFGLVFLVNGIMVYVATVSWTGLALESPYDRGIAYNDNLEAAARQAELGWSTHVDASVDQSGHGTFTLEVRDDQDQPLNDAMISATLERPVTAGHDMTLDFEPIGPGLYRASALLPLRGVWNIHLIVARSGKRHVHDERLALM